jgi:lipopolysaccharide export system ATP-binding protein
MKDALFVADSIGVSFGSTTILKAATFWARPGKVTLLMGRNGSGKTTLLRAALGLCSMDQGTVRFGPDVSLRPRLSTFARSGLFFLPAENSLSRGYTLRWHLRAMREEFGPSGSFDLTESLGLLPFLDHTPFEMSGGEERKAEIALAMARNPMCLLADEPLNGIAPKDQEVVATAIRDLADSGAAVLVTGHEVRELMELSDDLIWMASGTTHGLGTPTEAMTHDQFRREYLGASYCR